MSPYNTLRISRTAAYALFEKEVMQPLVGDDHELTVERFLDDLFRERLYNALIVDDEVATDDHQLRDILRLTEDSDRAAACADAHKALADALEMTPVGREIASRAMERVRKRLRERDATLDALDEEVSLAGES